VYCNGNIFGNPKKSLNEKESIGRTDSEDSALSKIIALHAVREHCFAGSFLRQPCIACTDAGQPRESGIFEILGVY
jgi:hypothetical protein